MQAKIEAIQEYLKYFPHSVEAQNNLKLCEYARELEIELNESYYPKMVYGAFVINSQLKAVKSYNLTNSKTHYVANGEDTLIIWSESCGRLAFVSDEYWGNIEDEWCRLQETLRSYNPLDYDEINSNYIYDLENGKRLIKDYDVILEKFKKEVQEKINKVKTDEKRKEFERLKSELNEL